MRNRRDANVLKSALDRELQAVSRSHRSAKLLQAENSSDAEQGAPLLDETVLTTAIEHEALVLQEDREPRRVVVPIDIDVIVRVRKDLANDDAAAPWVDGEDQERDRRGRRRRTTGGRRRGRTTGRDRRRTRDERFETGRDRDGRRTTAGGRRGRTTGRDRRRSPGRRRETGGREE